MPNTPPKSTARQSFRLWIVALALATPSCAGGQEEPKTASQPIQQEPTETSKEHLAQTTNALAKETSPYLLMHAHNPVDWYPWGEAALQKAKAENKPIFLSIGYSSCHWCHVMERESFLDKEIAEFISENFVCIKVDREERPDVDAIYMESLHVINRLRRNGAGGGWPLSMFLTPEALPFFGGTYFPARDGDRGARIGFLSIAKSVDKNWRERNDRIQQDAKTVSDLTRRSLEARGPDKNAVVKNSWIRFAQQGLEDGFDPTYGGFRFDPNNPNIPKFPQPSNLFFLADLARRQPDNSSAKLMLVKTCERMMMGGIFDHLGGGFHRYSVDRFWHIPHFEKMLYDNGQLASVYTEAYELTGNEEFREVVESILSWVEREMSSEEGGFYSSLDAESEGEEGKFYRWDAKEIQELLGPEGFKLFAQVYGIDGPPNFEGKYYAPQLEKTLSQRAKDSNQTLKQLQAKLAPLRKKLFDARAKRPRPLLDSKILTSWNGMMIRGFADAGQAFKNDHYLQVAKRAADFGLNNLLRDDGTLWRTHTAGQSKLNAYLDDYACFIDGLLALHRADPDKKWLDAAIKLQAKQDELFWDEKNGGYFFTASNHEQLLVRTKNPVDNAVPAGNSVSANNLTYLAAVTGKPEYREAARKTVLAAAPILDQFAKAAPRLLLSAHDFVAKGPKK